MSDRIRLSASHFRKTDPDGPVIKPIKQWLGANQAFYEGFRAWLRQGGYSQSALNIYSVAARLTLGLLDKAYWQIDPQADLQQVRDYITAQYDSLGTRQSYLKGLKKLAHYLRLRTRKPEPPKAINWAYYLAALPDWLVADIQAYLKHQQRTWLPEQRHRATLDLVSHLTLSLRWMASQTELGGIDEITPQLWFDYVDFRLAQGIKPITLNGELHTLQPFVQFLAETGRPICARFLRVDPLSWPKALPRDVPLAHLRQVYAQIQADAAHPHSHIRRMGQMDRVWFLLMLHSGLRTGEVRRLRLADLDLAAGRVRIEQAKGLKDRLVYLSSLTVEAIETYLPLRGAANSDHLFLFRHQPLSVTYCLERLKTLSRRCGLAITPHQLRHSCATLLLNAGVPILTVQAILGHKHVDTTLGYARLYDGTVAADYYRAMAVVEQHLCLAEPQPTATLTPAHLLTLVDSLHNGTLNKTQQETVQTLRTAILTLSEIAS